LKIILLVFLFQAVDSGRGLLDRWNAYKGLSEPRS